MASSNLTPSGIPALSFGEFVACQQALSNKPLSMSSVAAMPNSLQPELDAVPFRMVE
jgi:hypothetical protein